MFFFLEYTELNYRCCEEVLHDVADNHQVVTTLLKTPNTNCGSKSVWMPLKLLTVSYHSLTSYTSVLHSSCPVVSIVFLQF